MNILDLLQADGFYVKRVATTRGGEYAGPCFFCGGTDRLRVWPNQGKDGKWWCRQCGKSGDPIGYLRDVRGMNFRDACEYTGKEIGRPTYSKSTVRPTWKPRATVVPDDIWQTKARMLVEEGARRLFHSHDQGRKLLDWLKEHRGLSGKVIRSHQLGLQVMDRWEDQGHWGLEAVLKDNGTPKKIWIPKGLIIPYFQGENILRIRIRRPKAAGDPRYYLLRGSDTRAMVWSHVRQVIIVVESELDGMLLHQEAGDLVGVVAIGNAQTRPDMKAALVLSMSDLILIALDSDDAGAREAWRWWTEHFPQAGRWPPIEGKDPGEMWAAGADLRAWIEAGLAEYGMDPAASFLMSPL